MKRWEILILTQPSRQTMLRRLLSLLEPQTCPPAVSVTVRYFKNGIPVGENRQAMIDGSDAEYISFIDDDDLVPKDYVSKILPLLDGVGIVGFKVQCYKDGAELPMAYHSLRHAGWSQDGKGLYRDLSYMQPIRRELALRSRIEGGHGEDFRWAQRLREIGCVTTEHYLDEVMYFYYYVSNKSDGVTA